MQCIIALVTNQWHWGRMWSGVCECCWQTDSVSWRACQPAWLQLSALPGSLCSSTLPASLQLLALFARLQLSAFPAIPQLQALPACYMPANFFWSVTVNLPVHLSSFWVCELVILFPLVLPWLCSVFCFPSLCFFWRPLQHKHTSVNDTFHNGINIIYFYQHRDTDTLFTTRTFGLFSNLH